MFAWYITHVKNPKGGVTYQVRYVLHYRLENRPTPSTPEPTAQSVPEPTALAPMPSTQSAPEPGRHPRPVILRHKDGKLYLCECCGLLTPKKYSVLTSTADIDDNDDDDPRYVSMCNDKCCWDYQNWCKSLIPGLPSNKLRITFDGICVPYNGGALHDKWRVQFVLVKEGRRTCMIVTPYDDEDVIWGEVYLTHGIPIPLNRLRKMYSKPQTQ